MENTTTQKYQILDYLKNHSDGITPQDAYKLFGCLRLSARIFDLRDMGYEILSIRESNKNKFGNDVSYCRYKLRRKQRNE